MAYQKIILVMLAALMAAQLVCGDSCASEYSCASCTDVQICRETSSGYQSLFRFSCPPAAPYCNSSGVCSPIPTLGCGPTDTFPCMRDGVFPDPVVCSKYHMCANGTSYSYTCPSYYYFNSDQQGCVRSATCYTFSCYGKTGVKVPYTNDAKYYAYCRDGVAVFVDSCPGAYKLDLNTQTCGPVCPYVGYKIADKDNCTKYFYCTKEPYASVFTVNSVDCPLGYGFDPVNLRCVPLALLPSCVDKRNN